MKVLLLSLPGIAENDGNLFPLGVGYLAAALKSSHEVRAFHYMHMSEAENDLPLVLGSFMPDVVGFTCTSFNRGNVRKMILLLKGLSPDIKVIVGGVHASFCAEQVLRNYKADIVVIGEGEKTLCELCDAIANGNSLHAISGIAFMDNGSFVKTTMRMMLSELNELLIPDFSFAETLMTRSGMGFVITSRGCPAHCSFCSTSSYWGQKVRMYSPTRVVDEMEVLINRFAIKKIFFHDDTFNLGIQRVIEICQIIRERGIKIEWGCSCRVVPVTENMVSEMVSAGCKHICWGVESGSASILKSIGKKITLDQIKTAFEISAKFSDILSSGCFVMVGNPGETEETINETVDFLNTLPMTDAPSTSILYILPGTPIYENLSLSGKIKSDDWARYDSVPYYTLENSYSTLTRWQGIVTAAGKRLPFDRKKHFWHGELIPAETSVSPVKSFTPNKSIFRRIAGKSYRMLKKPLIIINHYKLQRPTRHIEFK